MILHFFWRHLPKLLHPSLPFLPKQNNAPLIFPQHLLSKSLRSGNIPKKPCRSIKRDNAGKVGFGRTLIDNNSFSGYIAELEFRIDSHNNFIL